MAREQKKILIVDDEKDFVEMVKWNLEKTKKYKVMTETEPKDAFALIKTFDPDLVLLDVMMPGMDGGDLARKIKADSLTKDIPVVFLTAIVKEDEVLPEGGVIGHHPFLAKPVYPEKLIECVEKNIRR